jgi:nucleoside 2-deoxyribosyltransferase
MKRLYVCGSFRFLRELKRLERRLKKEKVDYQISKKMDSRGMQSCLKRIDDADVIYVVNPEGYVGKSVCVDIGYARAKNKPMYVMYPVDDPPVMDLISGVLSTEALIGIPKEGCPATV